MGYLQISIEATEEQQEILISSLAEIGATGFEQTSTHLLAYFSDTAFPEAEINELLGKHTFHIILIPDQNWNAVWESNFQPVVVDDFCRIRADFHEPVGRVVHDIIITPKMSFGTGHHATTYLMIREMRTLDFSNKSVFDFGTGTGILAILAEKMGACCVDAIDVDDWSIKNARENFARNQCSKINIEHTSSLPDKRYDIVLANINRNVLLQYATAIKNIMNVHGCLLISGLLEQDEKDIVSAFNALGLRYAVKQERQGWISLLFTDES